MKQKLDRRSFFKFSGILAGGVLASSGAISNLKAQAHHHTHSENTDTSTSNAQNLNSQANQSCQKQQRGRMFFTNDLEFNTLKAATERIYPQDESGEGAILLGVPYFIDNQLAGAYGFNAREYMQGPFQEGKAEQGYQTPMNRREIFLLGLSALESESQKRHKQSFFQIAPASQDAILKDCEANKIAIEGISSKYFFTLLRDLTIAGVLSDPIYQGNDGQKGWKMMHYPGGQMSYLAYIESDEFVELPPMSLADMQ
ncbi:gluconate 2-dehydrogenase subunit 3 family protein [Helicobacter fennelliae]|uniref:gluconate 2-dehydrogenase subunit 3 family protein n=1 Tax=Helicobacter fennelliae TaxID=215 RepID=UPI000E0671F6|nr:gluconate 2-dehydrogenase subunit 3 family protein [Helicobacter fennelliae]STQ84907.1 Gluconate 2-dehydrogenase subunit 3 precursor [Helicobacter fennelliae]